MNAPAACAHCGGPIPSRTDPRGRKARYCSDACRAAASRARRELRHRQELAEARAQTNATTRTPAEKLTDDAETVRALTHHLTHSPEFQLTEEHHGLARAIATSTTYGTNGSPTTTHPPRPPPTQTTPGTQPPERTRHPSFNVRARKIRGSAPDSRLSCKHCLLTIDEPFPDRGQNGGGEGKHAVNIVYY